MLVSSQYVGQFLSEENVDVKALTAIFFFFYMLASTQDIAVDGWALTMLKPGNDHIYMMVKERYSNV